MNKQWTFRNKYGRFRIFRNGPTDYTLFAWREDDYSEYWAEGYHHISPDQALECIAQFEGEIY